MNNDGNYVLPVHVSARDLAIVVRELPFLHASRTPQTALGRAIQLLQHVFVVDYATWIGFTLTPRPVVTTFVESEPRATPRSAARLAQGILDHPFAKYYTTTRRLDPLRWSDFRGRDKDRHLIEYADVYTELGVQRLLGVPITVSETELLGLSLIRTGRDFTERDREMLALLQPHFATAYRTAGAIGGVAAPGGVVPYDALTFGLTPREREVGLWMTQGKTNAEIALILGITRRTVEKHVERVFDKLGVMNRASAVLVLRRVNAGPASTDGA